VSPTSRQSFPIRRRSRCKRDRTAPATARNAEQFCDRLQIRGNLESYFVSEGEGRKLAQVRKERSLAVVAAVSRAVRGVQMVAGEPVYERPWSHAARS
jgi:uncharacterized membrane-anchored protein